jgi:hypothetical protein
MVGLKGQVDWLVKLLIGWVTDLFGWLVGWLDD